MQSMKLGGGGRFQKLESKIAQNPKVTNPAAVAASVGRKKWGNKVMSQLAARGKK